MSNDPAFQNDFLSVKAHLDRLVDETRLRGDMLAQVQKHLDKMSRQDSIAVSDMFALQMQMNKLSQMSEMSQGIVSATNSAISSMARNIKS
ncbi:MAG: hypothetical protein QOI24_4248 [Acidobacteriota bacterium]|jgi:hypothetical protein|nr:hypothetical protein [Acidobacteriota bacterium]